ncbi:hypothetical protein [Pseudomonas citronellolis]|jgi:hypothetical protein|uniref:hypothetical protein n=1 Tax=Pseudomonas citronellolis TaxID=53408 RepID=UPI003C2FC485
MGWMLRFIFGSKDRCNVQGTGGMDMRFVFEFDLSAVDVVTVGTAVGACLCLFLSRNLEGTNQ